MKIGLTGQIGAGKSTVAAVFKQKGAIIVDADAIGKDAIRHNPVLLRRLVKRFGSDIVGTTGSLNTVRLANLAFADAESTAALNRLVHPYLLKELRRQVRAAARSAAVAVVDAALLHYWHLEREMDLTIAVSATRDVRIRRMQRRGISRADALSRDKAQLSFSEMRKRSDIVISNAGSRRELRRRALDLWRRHIAPAIDR